MKLYIHPFIAKTNSIFAPGANMSFTSLTQIKWTKVILLPLKLLIYLKHIISKYVILNNVVSFVNYTDSLNRRYGKE